MLLRRWTCAPLTGLLALPLTAAAAEPGPGTSLTGQLVQMGLGLLVVVGLIFLLGYLMRRVGPLAPQGGQHIRVISLYPLGPRDRLALVEVGGRQLLLGISPGRITTLHVLEEPVTDDAGAGGGDFARKLQAMLKRDQKP
ncbi:flagellar biosynthetic protein FliO [Halopseudomonas formosensis]|jgi:flagellar protein FliO/FliZ|uniref:Flagellar protein n=1 Tax=Halopseudomonas formosensis TaxID=1002526 RepID=A0A1I6C8X0_9GAMM|nr:flagellar biosynthetic protein FliO [Halopseudomonas formosensis]MDX9687286.1 flagellar biosynthetic protein FliO [Halopseudomonas formosensis]MDY3197731.1 flagellar biosynthetic protein FliO [Pseudomonadaceae bacterium]NLC00600.1 flagellar biosynthetic protein FliO [Halopseudomonas formosensis]SFQ89592.1 flagellar protein FliO/FliZ [Halopseudomonas formosensis]